MQRITNFSVHMTHRIRFNSIQCFIINLGHPPNDIVITFERDDQFEGYETFAQRAETAEFISF